MSLPVSQQKVEMPAPLPSEGFWGSSRETTTGSPKKKARKVVTHDSRQQCEQYAETPFAREQREHYERQFEQQRVYYEKRREDYEKESRLEIARLRKIVGDQERDHSQKQYEDRERFQRLVDQQKDHYEKKQRLQYEQYGLQIAADGEARGAAERRQERRRRAEGEAEKKS